jgi:hypothetical protein
LSALRHGKIERAIWAAIAEAAAFGGASSVLITSWSLVRDVYRPEGWVSLVNGDWEPTMAQRKAVTRAMHSFVGKHRQYALTGGQGRRVLYLVDTADPVSEMWAKLWVERRRGSKRFICRGDAIRAVSERVADRNV